MLENLFREHQKLRAAKINALQILYPASHGAVLVENDVLFFVSKEFTLCEISMGEFEKVDGNKGWLVPTANYGEKKSCFQASIAKEETPNGISFELIELEHGELLKIDCIFLQPAMKLDPRCEELGRIILDVVRSNRAAVFGNFGTSMNSIIQMLGRPRNSRIEEFRDLVDSLSFELPNIGASKTESSFFEDLKSLAQNLFSTGPALEITNEQCDYFNSNCGIRFANDSHGQFTFQKSGEIAEAIGLRIGRPE